MGNKRGFTISEILVVVFIIGVLVSLAIPAYKKSVEKSKVTGAINTMSAVARSEHAWYLDHNNYTSKFTNLDIDLTNKSGAKAHGNKLETSLYDYELLSTGILASRTNGAYSLYEDYNTQQILCSPGTHYICEALGAFTKVPCEKLGMAWANRGSTCYVDNEARCKGLYGDDMWKTNDKFCGYSNTTGKEINEGMFCVGAGNKGCQNSIVNYGGKCISKVDGTCMGSIINDGGECVADLDSPSTTRYGCLRITVNNGGKCIADTRNGCHWSKIESGGKCVANVANTCNVEYYHGTGCCEGNHCPSSSPKCRCPISETTGKHLTSC